MNNFKKGDVIEFNSVENGAPHKKRELHFIGKITSFAKNYINETLYEIAIIKIIKWDSENDYRYYLLNEKTFRSKLEYAKKFNGSEKTIRTLFDEIK